MSTKYINLDNLKTFYNKIKDKYHEIIPGQYKPLVATDNSTKNYIEGYSKTEIDTKLANINTGGSTISTDLTFEALLDPQGYSFSDIDMERYNYYYYDTTDKTYKIITSQKYLDWKENKTEDELENITFYLHKISSNTLTPVMALNQADTIISNSVAEATNNISKSLTENIVKNLGNTYVKSDTLKSTLDGNGTDSNPGYVSKKELNDLIQKYLDSKN